jgi:hypothetical protein
MKTSTVIILVGVAGLAAWAYESGSSSGKYTGVSALRAGLANGLSSIGWRQAANGVSPGCCTGCQQQINGSTNGGIAPSGGVPNTLTAGLSQIAAINPGNATGTTVAQATMGGIIPVSCSGCN